MIELLVVISIISLLIALLLPALSAVRETARSTICAVNQRATFTALINYTHSSKDYLPPRTARWGKNTPATTTLSTKPTAYQYYIGYYGANIGISKNGINNEQDFKGLWGCPEESIASLNMTTPSGNGAVRSYWNHEFARYDNKNTYGPMVPPVATSTTQTHTMNSIKKPGYTLAITDGLYDGVTGVYNNKPIVFRHHNSLDSPAFREYQGGAIGIGTFNTYKAAWLDGKLNGIANMAMADGHVTTIKLDTFIQRQADDTLITSGAFD